MIHEDIKCKGKILCPSIHLNPWNISPKVSALQRLFCISPWGRGRDVEREMHILALVKAYFLLYSLVEQMVKNPPATAGDEGSISGSGRSPGEGNGNPLQYSCMGNLMGRGARGTAVYEVAKSQTWLNMSDWTHTHSHTHKLRDP